MPERIVLSGIYSWLSLVTLWLFGLSIFGYKHYVRDREFAKEVREILRDIRESLKEIEDEPK